MGEQIDFSMLRQSPFKGALDPIAAAVDQWAQMNHQRSMQKERLDQQNKTNDRLINRDAEAQRRNQAREDLEERRYVGQQTLTNQAKQRATEDDVRKALAEASVTGDYSNAQRLIEGFSSADPATGNVKQGLPGASFKPHSGKAEPQRPELANLPPDIEQGPIPSPEDSANAAAIRAAEPDPSQDAQSYPDILTAEMGRAANEGSRFAAQQSRAPDQEAAQQADQVSLEGFQREFDGWKSEPPSVELGGVRQDPEAIRTGQGRMAAQGFSKVGDALESMRNAAFESGDEEGVAAVERKLGMFPELLAGVEAGQDPKLAFKQLGAISMEQMKGEHRMALAKMNNDASMDRTNAQGKFGLEGRRISGQYGVDAAKARGDEKEKAKISGTNEKAYARVQADMSTFDKQHNVSTDRKEEMRMQTLMDHKDVQGVQRAMATQLARGLAGEKGALSNQDIARIQGDLGGMWGSIANWLERKGTGDLDPTVLDQLVKSTAVVLDEKRRGRAAGEAAFAKKFLSPTYVGQRWGFGEDLLGTFEEKFGHPYEAAPSRGGGRVDPGNPDDPNGPGASEPLGGDAPDPTQMSREEKIRRLRAMGIQ